MGYTKNTTRDTWKQLKQIEKMNLIEISISAADDVAVTELISSLQHEGFVSIAKILQEELALETREEVAQ